MSRVLPGSPAAMVEAAARGVVGRVVATVVATVVVVMVAMAEAATVVDDTETHLRDHDTKRQNA